MSEANEFNDSILDDPEYRIDRLNKQLGWAENQRYDLETTISSLRSILKLIVQEPPSTQRMQVLFDQAKRMLPL